MPKLSLKPFHVFHVVSRTAWMMWDGYFVSNRSLWGVVESSIVEQSELNGGWFADRLRLGYHAKDGAAVRLCRVTALED